MERREEILRMIKGMKHGSQSFGPKKFGKLANHKQEPWKMPLPLFIEHLYRKQFGRERPEAVMSLE